MGKFALLMYMSEFRLRVVVVLMIGNSKSNHLGAQGTFKAYGGDVNQSIKVLQSHTRT